MLTVSRALHKQLDEQLDFLEPIQYKNITHVTANELSRYFGISKDTFIFERIKKNFDNICLHSQLMQLPNYTIKENILCSNIVYTLLSINLKRETVLNALILKLHQFSDWKEAVEGYNGIVQFYAIVAF